MFLELFIKNKQEGIKQLDSNKIINVEAAIKELVEKEIFIYNEELGTYAISIEGLNMMKPIWNGKLLEKSETKDYITRIVDTIQVWYPSTRRNNSTISRVSNLRTNNTVLTKRVQTLVKEMPEIKAYLERVSELQIINALKKYLNVNKPVRHVDVEIIKTAANFIYNPKEPEKGSDLYNMLLMTENSYVTEISVYKPKTR